MEQQLASLESAVRAALANLRRPESIATLQDFLLDGALVIDEDAPFVLDKAEFRDHLEFHAASWESVTLATRAEQFRIIAGTGVVTGLFTLRGKPKDSGFRLRHGNFSLVCVRDGDTWRALSLTFGTLLGHVADASPA